MKERVIQGLQQQAKTPSSLARRARDLVLFGGHNRVSLPDEGTIASIQSITLDDVKDFYAKYYSPSKASVVVVGNLPQQQVMKNLAFIGQWQGPEYSFEDYKAFPEYDTRNIFLVDSPSAVQSIVYVVQRALAYDATGDYFKARLMNFPLGGGFNSRINLNLREDKGITYGANSAFLGGKTLGWFEVSADVTADQTQVAINEMFAEIENYIEQGPTEDELKFMRNAFTLSDALEFETPTSKARFLRQLQNYNLSKDYRKEQVRIIQSITKDEIKALASRYLIDDKMQIIVVGDKASLLPQLQSLGMPIIELSVEANHKEALN